MPDIALTWLGHAAFRFDTPGGKRVYVDPFLENPKCPDNEREPERVVDPAAEELEVVRDHDERSEGDEHRQPAADPEARDDADRDRPQQRHRRQSCEDAGPDPRPERPPVKLVERMKRLITATSISASTATGMARCCSRSIGSSSRPGVCMPEVGSQPR